jgi:hypothetical protein
LTQKLTAELFQTTPQNTILHLKNIFEEGELEEKATCKDLLIVQNEGELLPEETIRKYRIVQKEGKGCPPISKKSLLTINSTFDI